MPAVTLSLSSLTFQCPVDLLPGVTLLMCTGKVMQGSKASRHLELMPLVRLEIHLLKPKYWSKRNVFTTYM